MPTTKESKRISGKFQGLLANHTVLIADDHPIVREGLATLINSRSDMPVVAEASNGQEAVEKYVAQSPDIALLELELPIMDGVETVMSIYKEAPDARLVVFTTRQGEVIRAVANGKSNKEIAAALVISEATVKVHVTHILEKLKVAAQTEAINVAVRRGLVRLDLIGAA